jgi:hypothetical protein
MKYCLLILSLAGILLPVYGNNNLNQTQKINKTITGYYSRKGGGGDVDILLMPENKIKFELIANWETNTGTVCAILPLDNNVAVYKKGNCEIKIKFEKNRVVISQVSPPEECDFGNNVTAEGIYIKKKTKADFSFCDKTGYTQ